MLELKITADTAENMAKQLTSLASLYNGGATIVYVSGVGAAGGGSGAIGTGGSGAIGTGAALQDEPVRRTRGPNKPKDDGVALTTITHPVGEPVAEDADVSPESLVETETEVADTVEQGGADVPALSYEDDIKPAILLVSMRKQREGVFRVLGQFGEGIKSAKEIDPKDWPALLEAVEAELAAA